MLMDPKYRGWTKANVIHAARLIFPILVVPMVGFSVFWLVWLAN